MHLTLERPANWGKLLDEKQVYLISPASGSSDAEMQQIVTFLKDLGIEAILFDFPQGKNEEPFLAQSDEIRLAELKEALNGDKSSIILTTRGGYGSARLIKKILKLKPPQKNKILAGFSDVTSLHLAFNNCWSLPSLHAPVLKQCASGGVDKESLEQFLKVLEGENKVFQYPVTALNELAENVKPQTKFAPLLGGNLSLIQTSISTPWEIKKSQPFCLLIEEVDEKAYAIDRTIRHLLNVGLFDNCEALFIGDIDENPGADNKKHFPHVLEGLVKELNIPIFSIPNIGHGKKNLSIPLGIPCLITKA